MKKRILTYVLILTIVVPCFTFGLIYAVDDRERLDEVRGNISQAEADRRAGRQQVRNLAEQIANLEARINATEAEINALQGNIRQMEGQIDEAQAGLDALQEDIYEQQTQLNARLRAMYMNGNISLLDILLGSSSIVDFMVNMDRIRLIHESDVAVIEALDEQHRILEEHRQHLDSLRAGLVEQREQEARRRAELQQTRDETEATRAQAAQDVEALDAMITALNREANNLIEEILRRQGTGDFVGGDWIRPVQGRVSSEFGYRIHPILRSRRLHTGIDIAAPTGTPIRAANDGVVIMQGWNNSYGNMIMIDHGGGIVTLYAHNSVNLVREGDVVARGQEIGRVGSTGMSTGPHLHFEVRVNGRFRNPRDFVAF